MNVQYMREMKHNYMIIEPVSENHLGYEARMLVSNRIEGLLKFRLRQCDDRWLFYYEITSRQPLDRLLERRYISLEEIRQLIFYIGATLERIESYLLREAQILLDPTFIYIDSEGFIPSLCMVPGYEGDFTVAFSRLLQYLLEKIDHRDKECVVLAYGLYHESLKMNYGMEDIMNLLTAQKEVHKAEVEEELLENWEDVGEIEWKEQGEEVKKTRITVKKKHKGQFLFPLFVMLSAPLALWFFKGIQGFRQYGLFLAVGEVVLLLLLMLKTVIPEIKKAENREIVSVPEENRWKVELEEMDQPREEQIRKREPIPEEQLKTTLLFEDRPQELCILYPVDHNEAQINISYVPFLIGKNEQMADCVLNRMTVSRLHIKIDRDNQGFWAMDLNSTNGTTVNGETANANQIISLAEGDLVQIADLKYRYHQIEKEHGG